MNTRAVVAATALAALALATGARGEEPTAGKAKAPRRVIRLEAIRVEGRIQKPQAFYILQRSSLSFDELNRPETFIPNLEKSVKKSCF
jgi:hypothetical protein